MADMDKPQKRMSLVTGASLFLALVLYFNIRSVTPMNVVDWAVIGFGVLFLVFALVRRYQDKKQIRQPE